ncbi:MAG: endonuclease/exonuclease/phosphatase family protein, partial [Pseudomonadota bacterium]
MPAIRIVTLNLWGDREPLLLRLEAAAHALAALAPDVLFIQEARVGAALASENTANQLARRLSEVGGEGGRGLGGKYEVVYACAVSGGPGTWGEGSPAGEEGLAIVARPPIAETLVTELPDARPKERRILLSARLADMAVWCHTTHLHWRLDDGLARERQVAAIDGELRRLQGDWVHILGGDFNASPDTDEIRFLCGRHSLDGRRTYYQDAFARIHPEKSGWTWARRNPNASGLAWLEIDRRIDYVFV